MRASVRLAALTTWGVALAWSGAASGQSPPVVSLAHAATRAVFELCPAVFEGQFDMNNAAALAPFGVVPAPSSIEASFRAKVASVEMARGRIGSSLLTIITFDPHRCIVQMEGRDRLTARDAVMAMVEAKGGTLIKSATLNGTAYREYALGDLSITSQALADTSTSITSIAVTPLKYR